MTKTLISLLTVALLSVPAVASAASLTNQDDVAYTVVVSVNEEKTAYTVEPKETLDPLCDTCAVALENDPDGVMEVVDTDKLVIKDGVLAYGE